MTLGLPLQSRSECQWMHNRLSLPEIRRVSQFHSQSSSSPAMITWLIDLSHFGQSHGPWLPTITYCTCLWRDRNSITQDQKTSALVATNLADSPCPLIFFSWLPSGLGSWFRTITQFGFFMLFLILLCKIIFKLCSHCLSNCCGNDVPPKNDASSML